MNKNGKYLILFIDRKRVHLILLTLLLSLFAKANNDELVINVVNAVEGEIRMSQLFENDIEYIPLETTTDCLLRQYPYIYITKEYIIATNVMQSGAYLFCRKTGKFIKEIGKEGSGPEEYKGGAVPIYAYMENLNILLFDDINVWKGFDIESNKPVLTIKNPMYIQKYAKEKKYEAINLPLMLKENVFVGYTNNTTGKIPYKLITFNSDGEVIKEFPNYIFYENNESGSPFNPGVYYRYKSDLYFKELFYNDTVFKISEDKLTPHIIFELGKNKMLPPSDKTREKKINGIVVTEDNINKWRVSFVTETDNYIFFRCAINLGNHYANSSSFWAYYDKNNHSVIRSKNKVGFINDIDNLLDFWPKSDTQNGEFIGTIESETLISYLESNNDKVSEKIKKLPKLKEDDNPIVIIAKLRK